MRNTIRPLITATLIAVVAATLSNALADQTASTNLTAELPPGQMPYFDAVNDPIEGFNRCSWAVNEWLFRGVIYPFSVGYTFVAPKPVRTGISQVGHNLTYPVRLVNSCLQGKWSGAWAETERFGVNSTVGLAGFFDPATHWKIGRSEEDFGLTLGHWGCKPGFYLMLPILGPSSGRDGLGLVADWPLDIAFWIGREYPNDLWPEFIRPGFTLNDLSGQASMLKRQLDSLVDPYQALRTLYSLNRARLVADFKPDQGGNFNPDPTVGAVLFKPKSPDFVDQAVARKILIPATGKKLTCNCWMQPKPAPMVYYIPGLGSYRLDQSVLAYADMMFRHGYSVVVFSNPFQQDFMRHASTLAVPGYGPADCDDVVNVLQLIRNDMQKWQGAKITGNYLTGVSHGGYFTLMIAEREAEGKLGGLTFDRYVAVEPPVQLIGALHSLDEMFDAPLAWPASERRQRMIVAIDKALYFAQNGLDVSGDIPLTREESQFLIGLAFRYMLMSVIVDSQRRDNLGVLKVNPDTFVRQKSYHEIRQIDYSDYMDRFVIPYLIKTGHGTNRDALLAATDLEQSTRYLQNNPKVRVQICEDDFLLSHQDISWYRSTLGTNLTVYAVGGHLGNLHIPAVQEKLVKLFSE
ncbi:MAG TPA: VacJ family lipoprotein [Candidatus Acidoferrum sp.]|nr:VacJ family lipoprotein [Candidatus Acidoferrum sp.]